VNAYVQEWFWRYAKARGIAKFVLLAIGRRMQFKGGVFETPPLPLDTIVDDTGLVDSTVREHMKVLGAASGELEVVRGARRGEVHRYRLRREVQLPLMDAAPPAVQRRLTAVAPPPLGDEDVEIAPPIYGGDSAETRRPQRRQSAVTSPADGGAQAGGVLSSQDVRTEVPTSSQAEAAAGFIAWFLAEYPMHRNGVRWRIQSLVKTEAAVRELLNGRSIERAQAMAVAMWHDTAEPWLNRQDNDRGIIALVHKSTYLEGVVVAQQPKEDDNGHVPPCRSRTECIERVLREGREARAQGASA
jgi:hypothetical protein